MKKTTPKCYEILVLDCHRVVDTLVGNFFGQFSYLEQVCLVSPFQTVVKVQRIQVTVGSHQDTSLQNSCEVKDERA